MKLKSRYGLNQDLTPEQFEELRSSGDINPDFTWQDYLEMKQECAERRRLAEAEAARLGYELEGPEPPDLTEEDEAIFAELREQSRRQSQQPDEAAA